MPLLIRAAQEGERLLYRVAGLPVAVRGILPSRHKAAGDVIRSAFAIAYWQGGLDDWLEIGTASLLWPVVVLAATAWFTFRNGPTVRNRDRKGLAAQAAEQLKLYFTDGVLSPWYYIFALHDGPSHSEAKGFLHRFETKSGIYPLLRQGVVTELNDKKVFADFCRSKGVPAVPYFLYLDGSEEGIQLPDCDLFVKPANGRGGRGAERWDWVSPGLFKGPAGLRLTTAQLAGHLETRAQSRPLLVQERVKPHHSLAVLTSGALPTVRVTTCLGESGDPEVVSGVFRMAIGNNQTVDNLHAGGLAAGVGINDGRLSSASNLGMDARLGWLDRHPDTGAAISGRRLPLWKETKALALQAHRAFADRVLVGWDIAITDDGPIVVEGNSSPDLDIIQRFGSPVCNSRLGELLAWHLHDRGFA
jgi:glutathione synthase/RimK-type ligase-like ATP-grasp enzyme